MKPKNNISKALYELGLKQQMQQSIYCALCCLDEWEGGDHKERIQAARDILDSESRAIGDEIVQLQELINGGELDLDEALTDARSE